MTQVLLELVGVGGGLAVRWFWQASLLAAVIVIATFLTKDRFSGVAEWLLLVAFVRFALPPLTNMPWAEAVPVYLSGPRQQGLELMVANEAGVFALAWPGWLLLAYLVGVTLAYLRLGGRVAGLARLKRESYELTGDVARAAGEIADTLRLRRTPLVVASARCEAPFVAGVVRPVIVLPAVLTTQLSQKEIRDVLAHELVHLQRGDVWISWLLALLAPLWWFNPIFRVTVSCWRRLAEERCDDAVIQFLRVTPHGYSRTLVRAASVCVPGARTAVGVSFFAGRHHLERRIRRIVGSRFHSLPVLGIAPRGPLGPALLAVGLALVLSVGTQANVPVTQRVVFVHAEGQYLADQRLTDQYESSASTLQHQQIHQARH